MVRASPGLVRDDPADSEAGPRSEPRFAAPYGGERLVTPAYVALRCPPQSSARSKAPTMRR
jgi:hypothetical protein